MQFNDDETAKHVNECNRRLDGSIILFFSIINIKQLDARPKRDESYTMTEINKVSGRIFNYFSFLHRLLLDMPYIYLSIFIDSFHRLASLC